MPNVSAGQIALTFTAVACFAASMVLSLLRLRKRAGGTNEQDRRGADGDSAEPAGLRLAAKSFAYFGLLAGVGVLVWHSAERGNWVPLGDNFATLACLGVLLAGFVLYMQVHHPLRGLDWFLLPVVILLLTAAAIFGQTKPHDYAYSTWSWTHRLTAYGGAAAFAVAGAAGLMYLIANRRLRSKELRFSSGPGLTFGSLERLERLTLLAVALGFALLTIGAVTGLARIADTDGGTKLGEQWFLKPKILLALGVWLVYAIVLHSPINPSFRGKKAAVLSVVGFLLMAGTLVAVQLV